MQQRADHAEDDGADESCFEVGHIKTANQRCREFQHDRVDDEPEQTQGKQRKWKGEDFEYQTHRCVDQADHSGRNQRGHWAAYADTMHDVSDDPHGQSAYNPMQQKTHKNPPDEVDCGSNSCTIPGFGTSGTGSEKTGLFSPPPWCDPLESKI